MKSYVICLLMCLLSTFAHGQTVVNDTSKEFHEKVLTLLAQNVDNVRLEGDVLKGEKLRPILEDLGEYLISPLFGDSPDESRSVRDFDISCHLDKTLNSADCMITLQYKPMGETSLLFLTSVDANKNPISILQNKIEVVRGD